MKLMSPRKGYALVGITRSARGALALHTLDVPAHLCQHVLPAVELPYLVKGLGSRIQGLGSKVSGVEFSI